MLETEQFFVMKCFDPEGTRIFIVDTTDRNNRDLLVINLEDEATIEPWLATPADESEIAISPNGRWAAYLSNETGRYELYVRSITGQQKQRISTDGASRQPMWSPDGAMLYYQDSVNPVYKLHAVTVTSGHEIVEDGADPSDTPFEWEPAGMILDLGSNNESVSMHPDGKRFIMVSSGDADVERPDSFEIHVVQNFFEILKTRASTKF